MAMLQAGHVVPMASSLSKMTCESRERAIINSFATLSGIDDEDSFLSSAPALISAINEYIAQHNIQYKTAAVYLLQKYSRYPAESHSREQQLKF